MVYAMKKYLTFCEKFNKINLGIGVLLLGFAALLTFVQVVLRNTISFSFTWAEEVTRYVVIFAVYFASGTVVALDQNAKVDMLYNAFPKIVKKILTTIFYILTAVFLVIMFYYGYIYVQRNLKIWCASIRIPWAVPFASLLVGSVNMLIQIPAKIYETWAEIEPKKMEGSDEE